MRAHAEVKAGKGKLTRQAAPVTDQLAHQADLGQALRRAGVPPLLDLGQPSTPVQLARKAKTPKEKPVYSIAEKAFDDAEWEKQFSKEELEWIKAVFRIEELARMFLKYKGLPVAVLHRVEKAEAGSAGVARDTQIAITDVAYRIKENQYGSDEVKFKATLIHELTHFLLRQVQQKVPNTLLPKDLVTALCVPEAVRLPKYAFGWFEHPISKLTLHFDVPEVCGFDPSLEICNPGREENREVREVRKENRYEHSPLPKSGNKISPEEDLAESFALYLSSSGSRKYMQEHYPLRFNLLEKYFAHLEK